MRGLFLICVGCFMVVSSSSWAHNMRTAFLECDEKEQGIVDIVWRKTVLAPNVRPEFPQKCKLLQKHTLSLSSTSYRIQCPKGLRGKTIHVRGLGLLISEAILSIKKVGEYSASAVLKSSQPSFRVPRKEGFWAKVQRFLSIGGWHALGGWDHVFFMLALVCLVASRQMLFWTVTMFTIAHSFTLYLASCGVVPFSSKAIECMIALSLLFSAHEILARKHDQQRFKPISFALFFGLFHGFGFAGLLLESEVSKQDLLPSLLGFNVGIECAQIVVVFLGLLLFFALRQRWQESTVRKMFAYTIGSVGSYFLFHHLL